GTATRGATGAECASANGVRTCARSQFTACACTKPWPKTGRGTPVHAGKKGAGRKPTLKMLIERTGSLLNPSGHQLTKPVENPHDTHAGAQRTPGIQNQPREEKPHRPK